MSWHGDATVFESYATGAIDPARASSLEAHILKCRSCQEGVARFVPPRRLNAVWKQVEVALDAPRPRLMERLLVRFGLPDHVARLLAATPSLRLSWFAALGVALGFAVGAAYAGSKGLLMFLIVAPLVPLAGVAAAYGPGFDPTYEIGLAAPMRSFRLLLIRSVAVVTTSLLLAALASLALPRLDWLAVAWLLPAMGLSAASLALSSVWPPLPASVGLAIAWVVIALAGRGASGDSFAAFRSSGQVSSLLLAAISVLILAHRRERFETRGDR